MHRFTGRRKVAVLVLIVFQPTVAMPQDSPSRRAKGKFVATDQYVQRTVEGWTVHVNKKLFNEQAELGGKALRLLEVKLYDIRRVVPARACGELQKVPIWLGVDDGSAPCAEYHPSKQWLKEHGFNPDKAKAVEIGNARRFLEWSIAQPSMVLHELAHAYHDRVLGFDHSGIEAAFKSARDGKLYASVLHINGKAERAYAIANAREYFAEATEAFFGTNDFYPFVKAELQKHDPRLFKILEEVWAK